MAKSKLEKYIRRDMKVPKEIQQRHLEVKSPVLGLVSDKKLGNKDFALSWWPISEPFEMISELGFFVDFPSIKKAKITGAFFAILHNEFTINKMHKHFDISCLERNFSPRASVSKHSCCIHHLFSSFACAARAKSRPTLRSSGTDAEARQSLTFTLAAIKFYRQRQREQRRRGVEPPHVMPQRVPLARQPP